MDMSVKVDLEDKIKEKYTIGYYEFDEINNCFWVMQKSNCISMK